MHGALQLRVLLHAQSRATEGFTFQGLEHIKDHAVVSLNDLSLAGPKAGQPALRGMTMHLPSPRSPHPQTKAFTSWIGT